MGAGKRVFRVKGQFQDTSLILQMLSSGRTALGHKSQQRLATFHCFMPLRVDSTCAAPHVYCHTGL